MSTQGNIKSKLLEVTVMGVIEVMMMIKMMMMMTIRMMN